tara:strand:+ start:794 stop:1117 length:324 start_codon:yes stop_codon:yes gene_type:complete
LLVFFICVILHNIQNITTLNFLTFDNGKYYIHAKDNNNDILDVIRHISPRAWAKTDAGRHFYKVFLPSQRKQGKEIGSWRYLEELQRRNISESYTELSEYGDPEIPF